VGCGNKQLAKSSLAEGKLQIKQSKNKKILIFNKAAKSTFGDLGG
jgi:hypothetical protein